MQTIESHEMRESQAMMILEGEPYAPSKMMAVRAGVSRYRSHNRCARQHGLSLEAAARQVEAMAAMEREIGQKLERFKHLGASMRVQGLARERTVRGVAGYRQRFAGFWGTLRLENTWDSVFGGVLGGPMLFRRGIWEQWSPRLPKIEKIDPRLPLVLSPYCATLLHEAVGHAAEADYLDGSPLKYHVGERVSHDELTIMDRPDLNGFPGSMTHDDTGRGVSGTTLIHRGFLVGDLDHARGVFRRGSFREIPQIRATNFVVNQGTSDPRAWLSDLPRCLYVSGIQTGNWIPGTHKIKVMTGPVFLLEKGSPVAFVPWAPLNFSTLNLLDRIIAIGNDLCMDPVVHWCMKKNQSVPIGMGAPSILIRGLNP